MRQILLLCMFFYAFSAFGQNASPPEQADYESFKPILEGFSSGQPLLGSWSLKNNTLSQTDTTHLYTYFVLPLEQSLSDTLFRFSARSSGEGWIAYGLHIFASDSRSTDYGFGQSILVWLTRDPVYYKNESTYLQLYRSFNDTTMNQLASVMIGEQISDELVVEIYYSASNGILSLSVNGDVKLFFPVKGLILNGKTVALRVLRGPVTFSGMSIFQKNDREE